MVVDSQDDLRVVGQAVDGSHALDVVAATSPDVVLMDVRMPKMDGVEATRRLLERYPDGQRVIVVTTFDLDEHAFAALKAGASGFLLKDASAEDVLVAIRAVHAGDAVLAPSTTRRLIAHVTGDLPGLRTGPDPLKSFTVREREVLLEVATGAGCSPNSDCATGCTSWCWPTYPAGPPGVLTSPLSGPCGRASGLPAVRGDGLHPDPARAGAVRRGAGRRHVDLAGAEHGCAQSRWAGLDRYRGAASPPSRRRLRRLRPRATGAGVDRA